MPIYRDRDPKNGRDPKDADLDPVASLMFTFSIKNINRLKLETAHAIAVDKIAKKEHLLHICAAKRHFLSSGNKPGPHSTVSLSRR